MCSKLLLSSVVFFLQTYVLSKLDHCLLVFGRTERDVISDWLQNILKSMEKTNDLEVGLHSFKWNKLRTRMKM